MDSNLLIAIALTSFAGISTGIGSVLAFFSKKTNRTMMAITLGFSAGVMIYVSFMEIIPKAIIFLEETNSTGLAKIYVTIGFFSGILIVAFIDYLVPNFENPHELQEIEDYSEVKPSRKNRHENLIFKSQMKRMGIFSAIAIAIHNFPEGLVTFLSTLKDPSLGVPIAIAIAMHNIPEGIAVSIPIFFATGSRKKAFYYSFLSGLAEPLGGIIGYLLLRNYLSDTLFGILFSIIAGVMVYISMDELLPAAQKYGKHHLSIFGLILGMVVMAMSLLLLM